MNTYLLAAATLAFVVGLVHSILGEVMIFSRMREGGFVPTNGGTVIGQSHVRILWASWHVLTLFGWLCAAALLLLAIEPPPANVRSALLQAVSVAMLLGAAVVFYATRARHPGWLGLLGVAGLVWLGMAP